MDIRYTTLEARKGTYWYHLGMVFLSLQLAIFGMVYNWLWLHPIKHLSTEAPRYGERPLCSIALCYVFYSVLRLLFLFAGAMAMALCGSKLLSETELSKFRTQLFLDTYCSMVFIMQVREGIQVGGPGLAFTATNSITSSLHIYIYIYIYNYIEWASALVPPTPPIWGVL